MKRTVMATLVLILVIISMWGLAHIYHGKNNVSPATRFMQPINAMEYQRMLGVGINVDWMTYSWVNHYYFYWRSRGVCIPKYFKNAGFSNVRIRVNRDVTTNYTALVQLASIVNDTLEAGLIPVITYTAPELKGNPTSRQARQHFLQWWLTVARYFKGYPYTLSYDLLIESSGRIKSYPGILNEIYAQAIREIRSIDPYRVIIVTPAGISSPFYLDKLNLTDDGYIIAEWHIYAGGPKGCTYNVTYIENSITTALNWSLKTGIPTWMGAWRPNVYPKTSGKNPGPVCSLELEENFAKTMVSRLSKAHLPYDINADTRFFNIENLTWYNTQKGILEIIVNHSQQT